MLKKFIETRIDASEKELGASMDYIKEILRISSAAFWRFYRIFSISKDRGHLPSDAYHTARIVAARDEDCGTCVQVEVNLALKASIPTDIVQSIITSRPELLPEPLNDLYRFVDAVVRSTGEDMALRPLIIKHYGERGLVEIALAIGVSRFLPICKRTMGYATQCSLVKITYRRD